MTVRRLIVAEKSVKGGSGRKSAGKNTEIPIVVHAPSTRTKKTKKGAGTKGTEVVRTPLKDVKVKYNSRGRIIQKPKRVFELL